MATTTSIMRERKVRAKAPPPRVLVISLTVFALLVVAAIVLDRRYFLQRLAGPRPAAETASGLLIDVATSTSRFRDETRAFSIALPDGWRVLTAEESAPYDVRIAGPSLMVIAVKVAEVRYTSIDVLVGRLRNIEQEKARNTHIERVEFKGYPGVRRVIHLNRETVFMLDVLAEGREYHVQYSVPSDIAESHRPVVEAMLESFEPVKAVSGDEATL
ncbi:MAG: hypothetical protein V1929_10485 [bacterium]